MTHEEREIPRPQRNLFDITLQYDGEGFELLLHQTLKKIGLQFSQIHSVIDLYCGIGELTLGSILAFPNAQIHALDYHDVLASDAKNHSRVNFYQGWVTDTLLMGKDIPKADIVLMSNASRHHGFNESNISLLSSHVGKYLLTVGDNDGIEVTPWFRNKFVIVSADRVHLSAVWKLK